MLCTNRLLRKMNNEMVARTFFTDEKMFTVDTPRNSQNNHVYSHAKHKNEIKDERLYATRSTFPKNIMVSVGVSKLGKTSIFFIEPGVKVNGQYYRDTLLAQMIPEMNKLSNHGHYIFQQDGARAHTAKDTIAYLESHVPDIIPPDMWSPNSPYLNPVDYGIWESLSEKVYRHKKQISII